jgi:hypothetical protein
MRNGLLIYEGDAWLSEDASGSRRRRKTSSPVEVPEWLPRGGVGRRVGRWRVPLSRRRSTQDPAVTAKTPWPELTSLADIASYAPFPSAALKPFEFFGQTGRPLPASASTRGFECVREGCYATTWNEAVSVLAEVRPVALTTVSKSGGALDGTVMTSVNPPRGSAVAVATIVA